MPEARTRGSAALNGVMHQPEGGSCLWVEHGSRNPTTKFVPFHSESQRRTSRNLLPQNSRDSTCHWAFFILILFQSPSPASAGLFIPGAGLAGLGERWPSRLVATAISIRLRLQQAKGP
jgi:hypothetical protein